MLLPTASLLANRRTVKAEKTHQIIAWLIAIAVISETINLAVYFTEELINTLPLLHLYTVLEFSLLLLVFHYFLEFLTRRRMLLFMGGFVAVELVVITWFQSIYEYNTVVRTLESLVLLVMALLYFRQVLDQMREHNLIRSFAFWFSAAVLLYFSGNLIVFASSNLVRTVSLEINVALWSFHAILNILFNALLAFSLWMKPQTTH